MARVLGLTGPFLVWLLVLGLLSPGPAVASSNPSYDQAMANCNAYSLAAHYPSGGPVTGEVCNAVQSRQSVYKGGTLVGYGTTHAGAYGDNWGAWAFTGTIPNPCEDAQPYPASYGSNISVCHGGCMYDPDPSGTTDTVRSGSWLAQLHQTMYRPTGQQCPPDAPPEPPTAGRTLCGGSSCHDTAAGKYCAVDGNGVQVCVSDSTPPSGGCASSGDTTLCVGNPPPLPPNPPIADPASSAAGSDTYGHQSGNGAVSSTTVNNYNNTGSSPNNGAQAGDSGDAPGSNNPVPGGSHDPASSSSSGAPKGDGTRASGGQDCNSPPICEGSAATCMVAKQTWLLRCPPGGQAGDDSGSAGQDGNTDVPGLDGIGDTPGEGFMRSETVLDKLDQGGLGAGGGTCPKLVSLDLDQYGVHLDSDALPWCDILDAIRYMLLFLGAFLSLRILSSK